jgi:hypothetical protein
MKRSFAAITIAALLVLITGPSAQARKPVRQPVPDFNATVPAGLLCPFKVVVRTVVNREKQLTYLDADGNPVRATITGRLVARITNGDSGASVVRNISGPLFLKFHADGSVTLKLTGISNVGLFPGDDGGPALLITHGLTVLQISADGTITDFSTSGRVEDLCQTLG